MASKGPKKLDPEPKAKRQKTLDAPRGPLRPKTHWDHVLEEMIWLSKDFESERKWKLALAKKVAIRASKSMLDEGTREEKKAKVLYKHQLELDERKKKALDKQLDFLLGQTERYSTMLAENLGDISVPSKPFHLEPVLEHLADQSKGPPESQLEAAENDGDYGEDSEDESDDDEHTIEEDEAHITEEERREELAALQDEIDLPLEELLKCYTKEKVRREGSSGSDEDLDEHFKKRKYGTKESRIQVNGFSEPLKELDTDKLPVFCENHQPVGEKIDANDLASTSTPHGLCLFPPGAFATWFSMRENVFTEITFRLLLNDKDYVLGAAEEKDDETTLSEEEELAKEEANDPADEIMLLQQESEVSLEELLARYRKDAFSDEETLEYALPNSEDQSGHSTDKDMEQKSQRVSMDEDAAEKEDLSKIEQVNPVMQEIEMKTIKMSQENESESIIADAAAAARSAQPTGNTFSTTKVRTKFPFLLKYPLREYQHIGLDWLVTMYEKRLNGILADEMGLGKTIMTISLLAHLACEKGIWGPHLIVVPTSVMLNWETEFLKWCPAFKILTYFGSAKERRLKRQGWLKPNSFHICITTYRLVIQDAKVFKRKKWKYLILDEAHLIKNWKSQRWQTLLNFNSKRRILLTGTPLQNDLMELWSLMHFLMPHIFQSHQEFKDWFCNPISGMVEGQEKVNKEVVDRLHNVLRPFILRRLKRDVEKQLPRKFEHVIYCRLSRRQRNLYEDFIASSETQATLASANFFGMISVIMQLRKVCNHPDLFEGRPILSSFDMAGIDQQLNSAVCTILSSDPFSNVDLMGLSFLFTHHDFSMPYWESDELVAIGTPPSVIENFLGLESRFTAGSSYVTADPTKKARGTNIFEEIQKALVEERVKQVRERIAAVAWWNRLKCQKKPIYGTDLKELVSIKHPVFHIHQQKNNPSCYMDFSSKLGDIVLSPVEWLEKMLDLIESFMFVIPAARAPSPVCWCSKTGAPVFVHPSFKEKCTEVLSPLLSPVRPAIVRRQVYFPDKRLIQFDCGKLQELAVLLRRLKSEGHRALIFTQMTKMLDTLEVFINLYGYTYMRLDGSTQPEERQTLMQRFNTNPKFFLFILSTRSGGVGINLVGADTVIFYDSDWNPAMDQQAQDRCHRIGQTREVHIYRLISESTIEENILKKANQKRALDDLVIQSGGYNTEFFKKLDPMELFSGHRALPIENMKNGRSSGVEDSFSSMDLPLSNADVEAALKQAEDEADYMALKKVEQEEAVDNQEFTEEAILRLEDEDLINDDDVKADEKISEGPTNSTAIVIKDADRTLHGSITNEEAALTLAMREEDVDMLADVKQMAAAAAAAGQASSSFENQLRPIDRYAMRFLELWDPIIDKSAIELQVKFEEAEWELDRIERFKEDLEAEIDEDEEPLVYERWDADFATEAYRQQVEALAQRQLMEEQEAEAKAIEDAEDEIDEPITSEHKRKAKKKTKKMKFKSLKKGALASESEALHDEQPIKTEHVSADENAITFEAYSPDFTPQSPPVKNKRKKSLLSQEDEEEKSSKRPSKKPKKGHDRSLVDSGTMDKQNAGSKGFKSGDMATDFEVKPSSKSKSGGKISIAAMPLKRVLLIKAEKLKKKGSVWSKDCIPSADSWSSQEDAILCAAVHEYSANWSLASDILYDMPAGGGFRGRFRHPTHCCERYRELFVRYVSSTATEQPNNEKASSGKALLKVTEDHIRMLLDVASEQADNELLLQKHFTAILSSVWRAKLRVDSHHRMPSSRSTVYSSGRFLSTTNHLSIKTRREQDKISLGTFGMKAKLLASALTDTFQQAHEEEPVVPSSEQESLATAEQMEITLEFQDNLVDPGTPLPPVITMPVSGSVPPESMDEPLKRRMLPESSCRVAESRLRTASKACFEGDGVGWASSAFAATDTVRLQSSVKSQLLGKHKATTDSIKSSKSKFPRTKEPNVDSPLANKPVPESPVTDASADHAWNPILLPFIHATKNDEEHPNSFVQEPSPTEFFEMMLDSFDPAVIADLDDCSSFSDDITDGWWGNVSRGRSKETTDMSGPHHNLWHRSLHKQLQQVGVESGEQEEHGLQGEFAL
ncbi:Pharynx and intestine in excess protein 1 [Asimina triloba]